MKNDFRVTLAAWCAMTLFSAAAAAATPIPQLFQKDGRHALVVDGKPFTMLGVQFARYN